MKKKEPIRLYVTTSSRALRAMALRVSTLAVSWGLSVYVAPHCGDSERFKRLKDSDALLLFLDHKSFPRRVRKEIRTAMDRNIPVLDCLKWANNVQRGRCPDYLYELLFAIQRFCVWMRETEFLSKQVSRPSGAGGKDEKHPEVYCRKPFKWTEENEASD